MKTKTCTTCGKEKPSTTEFFNKQKAGKDGLRSRCKDCTREYNSARYWKTHTPKSAYLTQENRTKIAEQQKGMTQREKEKAARERKCKRHPKKKIQSYNIKNKLKKYDLTLDEYNAMAFGQEYKCAICKRAEQITQYSDTPSLCVDHDHKTGKVRGLLCRKCNSILGFADDEKLILYNAIRYLETHNEDSGDK